MDTAPQMFLVPSKGLGLADDVRPERISSAYNDWIQVSREILAKKREAASKGMWLPTTEISEDHRFLRPFGGQYCPALQEISNIGYVLKWPQNAVVRREGPRAWSIETYGEEPMYKYHQHSSFPEAGIADVLSIALGWICVTPPGWSTMIKNIPNNLTEYKLGIQFAEGTIRTDQATIPIQAHAYVQPSAPDKIKIERGKPMCLVMPYRRDALIDIRILDSTEAREAAWHQAELDHNTFANAPGRYRELFIEDYVPSPLYPKLAGIAEDAPEEVGAPQEESESE